MHRFLQHAIGYFFPPLCIHCQREGDWLCADARIIVANISPLVDPITITGVDRILCGGDYDLPIVNQTIHRMKYDYWTAPAFAIVPVMLAPLQSLLMQTSRPSVIVPTPLHWRRRYARGFNQSEFIAAALSNSTSRPIQRLLRRRRFTTPQAQLKAAARATNVADAFEVQRVAKMPDSVILVDDVITTGSTIRECASVLRKNGVQHITAVALAKG